MGSARFKVWKNPSGADEAIAYMGEVSPPDGQVCLFATDLMNLGFTSGGYTVLVPDTLLALHVLPPWQRIDIP
jgi:hypothetical protein